MAFVALVVFSTFGKQKYKVRVCMTFNGQQSCKIASAATDNGALRTATEDACADIAGGVTDTVKCQNQTPQSVRWLVRP